MLSPTRTRPVKLGPLLERCQNQFAPDTGTRGVIESGCLDGNEPEAVFRWWLSDRMLSRRVLRWCHSLELGGGSQADNSVCTKSQVPGVAMPDLAGLARTVDVALLARVTLASALTSRLANLSSETGLEPTPFSRNCAAVGVVAYMIAEGSGAGSRGDALLAGVFRHLGIAAASSVLPSEYHQVLAETDAISALQEVEKENFGWTHAQLGALVAAQWGLPKTVCLSIRDHHDPSAGAGGESAPITCCVQAAEYLCARSGWDARQFGSCEQPTPIVFKELGIDADQLVRVGSQLGQTLQRFENAVGF